MRRGVVRSWLQLRAGPLALATPSRVIKRYDEYRKGRLGQRVGLFCALNGWSSISDRKNVGLWSGCSGANWRFYAGDLDGMQAFGPLEDFEIHRLASFECLVAVHFNSREVGEKVDMFIAVLAFHGLCVDEAEALGIVKPLDRALHTHIPLLQTTPSLEYHPVDSYSSH